MVTFEVADRLEIDTDGDYLSTRRPLLGASRWTRAISVARRLALVGRRAGVTVHKAIPPGGGLGGGSADAAAILRWAGGVSNLAARSRWAADVPFCQMGGRALVEGVGECADAPATSSVAPSRSRF